jgi:hypothetical protein
MVMMRALVKAMTPSGTSLLSVRPMSTPLVSGGAMESAAPVDEIEALRDFAREVLGTDGPMQLLAIARPVHEAARVARHLLDGDRLLLGVEVDLLARLRERHDVRLEELGEREPMLVRTRHELCGVLGGEEDALVAPVHAHALVRRLLLGGIVDEVDALAVAAEARHLARLADKRRAAAVG